MQARDDQKDGTTTITDVSATEGLENLHKYTLAAMQSEITTLKRELKKHEKVRTVSANECMHSNARRANFRSITKLWQNF